MGKIKIIYNRNECIGAGTCSALNKELWAMSGDGLATLKGATEKNGICEVELADSEYERQCSVAGNCPSGCIKVVRL